MVSHDLTSLASEVLSHSYCDSTKPGLGQMLLTVKLEQVWKYVVQKSLCWQWSPGSPTQKEGVWYIEIRIWQGWNRQIWELTC